MFERMKTVAIAVSNIVMGVLTMTSVYVQSFTYFQCWRRPEGCECPGCAAWQSVANGKTTVESWGQDKLRCQRRYLAWTDKVEIERHFNPGMALLWSTILLLTFVNPWSAIGAVAIVTNVGRTDVLTQYFKGSSYTAAWFVGLVDGSTTPTYANADIMASHAGWTENTSYSNATRPPWSGGSVTGTTTASIDNAGSAATFNINGTATIAGSFMVTNSTKAGSAGTLYSEASFTQGNRAVVSGDTLNSTCTQTMS